MRTLCCLVASSFLAQSGGVGAQQAPAVGVDQLSPPERSIAAAPPATSDPSGAAQVSSPAEGRRFERPAPTSGHRVAALQQLAPAGRSAAEPPPLSRPAEGRDPRIERIAGKDRCDPQAPSSAQPSCQHVIETRAGDYTRPDVSALSPEQRLLAERRIGSDPPRSVSSAAQRLANNIADPASLDAQAVAAVTLAQASEPAAPDRRPLTQTDDAANAAALVNAVLGGGAVVISPQGK